MRILAFAASLRRDSLNRKLLQLGVDLLKRHEGVEVDHADFHEFDMPLYDGDMETAGGLPAGAQELVRRLEAADALVISTPEYNHSYPGTLKNAIDWASRARPAPWKGQIGYLMSASTSTIGGQRSLWHLRQVLESQGTLLVPYMFGVPQANAAFDEADQLVDEKRLETLTRHIGDFVDTVRKLRAAQ